MKWGVPLLKINRLWFCLSIVTPFLSSRSMVSFCSEELLHCRIIRCWYSLKQTPNISLGSTSGEYKNKFVVLMGFPNKNNYFLPVFFYLQLYMGSW